MYANLPLISDSDKPEVVRPKDVQRILGYSKATAYRFIEKHKPSNQKMSFLSIDAFVDLTNIPRDRVKGALQASVIN